MDLVADHPLLQLVSELQVTRVNLKPDEIWMKDNPKGVSVVTCFLVNHLFAAEAQSCRSLAR